MFVFPCKISMARASSNFFKIREAVLSFVLTASLGTNTLGSEDTISCRLHMMNSGCLG